MEDLLKLLVAQFGPLGAVCLAMCGWLAWLHKLEKEDHKETRRLTYEHFEKIISMQLTVAAVLAEVKTLLAIEDVEKARKGR